MSTVQSQFSFARVTSAINAAIAAKQDTLVSGTNIKTINSTSLLGSGDIVVSSSTAPLVLDTNRVEQRNGTNGQIARWFKTYTSATNGEWLEVDAAGDASNFDIAACIGSAGGAARGIRIGGKNAAGTFTPWLSINTSGNTTIHASTTLAILRHPTGLFGGAINGLFGATRAQFAVGGHLGLATANGAEGAIDTRLCRFGAGQGAVLASTSITDSTTLGDWFMRDMIATPTESRTLATNGQLTFERVSDTECNLVYRGNDGTTRRSSLTFS